MRRGPSRFGAASAIVERRRYGGGSYNEKTLARAAGSPATHQRSIIVRRRNSASDKLAEGALFD
jgi:hypothetical protein